MKHRSACGELLEPRFLLAAVNLTGSSSADIVDIQFVGGNIRVANGGGSTFQAGAFAVGPGQFRDFAGVDTITGDLAGGNDSLTSAGNVPVPLNLSGGNGNDTLRGTNQNDTLAGGDGSDSIRGGLGTDNLSGDSAAQSGSDTIFGDLGGDSITGGNGGDALYGDDNDANLINDGIDTIRGGAGIDYINGNGGGDSMFGDSEDDLFTNLDGFGDFLDGGAGTDRASNEALDTRVDIENTTSIISAQNLSGFVAVISGTDQDDVITVAPDGGGADGILITIGGLAVQTSLTEFAVQLQLEFEIPTLPEVTFVSMRIAGGAGNDQLTFAPGIPTSFNGVQFALLLFGDAGNDALSLPGATAGAVLNGGDNNDTLRVGSGDVEANTPVGSTVSANGGPGSDSIEIDDNANLSDNSWVLSGERAFKQTADTGVPASGTIFFATHEAVVLNANDRGTFFGADSTAANTRINLAGGNDVVFVTNPTGDASNLAGELVINGGTGIEDVVLFDAFSGDSDATVIDGSTITQPDMQKLVLGADVENFYLDGPEGNNQYLVISSAPGTLVSIKGGGGDDFVQYSNGKLGTVEGAQIFDGQAGHDSVLIQDATRSTANTFGIAASTLTANGFGGLNYFSTESLTLEAGMGSDTIAVTSAAAGMAIAVNGRGGADTFDIGADQVDANIDCDLAIDGGGGFDTINLNDRGGTPSHEWVLADSLAYKQVINTSTRTSGDIHLALTYESLVLNATQFASTIRCDSTHAPTLINANAGDDTIRVFSSNPGADVTVDGGVGLDILSVNSDGIGPCVVEVPGTQDFSSVSVNQFGTLGVGSNAASVLRTQSLFVSNAGQMNLRQGTLLLDYAGASPLATIRTLITQGFAGGSWNGNGISSSAAAASADHALGYAQSTELFSSFPAMIAGQPIDSTTVIVRYTRSGDANLDRIVDIADFASLASRFNQLAGWAGGNFSFDGLVDLVDFATLAANFNQAA